jgi:hypothetical protein
MAFPKITYNNGTAQTLTFTYPPVAKPGVDDLEQQRTDSISLSGLKQSISVRTDDFFNLQMDFVPIADLPAWQQFMQYALTGVQFQYYPDASIGVFTTFTLEDTKWLPTRAFFGTAKFKLRFRKVPS